MLTTLANGNSIDLAIVTLIQVCESETMSVTGTIVPNRVVIKWNGMVDVHGRAFDGSVIVEFDTLAEAQAEAARLTMIANMQRKGVVQIANEFFRASDVRSVLVSSILKKTEGKVQEYEAVEWKCSVHLKPHGIEARTRTIFDFATKELAENYARDLMTQVAGIGER
jgi:hypothetical protein